MLRISTFAIFLVILQQSVAPPVDNKFGDAETNEIIDDSEYGLEYGHYIKEVVKALESDQEFTKRLEATPDEDIKSGKIADSLDLVNHKVRSKLDEIKRIELDRLKRLYDQEKEWKQQSVNMEHINHLNPHTFEKEDFQKLISKASKDLAIVDSASDKEFKKYEEEKEFKKRQKMKEMNDKEREEFEKKEKEEHERQKKHEPLHHPGSKPQLEEVWKEEDHMSQQFDPKTFFHMHDVDGNGVWDMEEVEALFVKELDKVYDGKDAAKHDPVERKNEMKIMRRHVFNETDLNRDGLIDLMEFMISTNSTDFQTDPGWNEIDNDNRYFTEEEYLQYEQQRLAMEQHQYGHQYPNQHQQYPVPQQPQYEHGAPPQYQQQPYPGHQPQQGQYQQVQYQDPQHSQYQQPHQVPIHPNQVPIHPNQVPIHPNQVPIHPNQVPMHPNQVPIHPNQVPIQQNQVPMHQNQVPMHPNQVPIQQHQVPIQQNQVPMHPNQVPIQQHQVPIQQNQVPMHQNQVPINQNQVPIQQNQVPVQQKNSTTNVDENSIHHGT